MGWGRGVLGILVALALVTGPAEAGKALTQMEGTSLAVTRVEREFDTSCLGALEEGKEFVLKKFLAAGSDGSVYLAEPASTALLLPNCRVVLKLIHGSVESGDREIEAFDKIKDCDGVVKLEAVFEARTVKRRKIEHYHVIAYEFGGVPMDKMLKDMSGNLDVIFQALYQFSKTLMCFNKNGVMHHDIKPDNLFYRVNPDDPGSLGRFYIHDFGKAILAGDSNVGIGKTQESRPRGGEVDLIGGIGYELIPFWGDDVYKLGVSMVEMMTGEGVSTSVPNKLKFMIKGSESTYEALMEILTDYEKDPASPCDPERLCPPKRLLTEIVRPMVSLDSTERPCFFELETIVQQLTDAFYQVEAALAEKYPLSSKQLPVFGGKSLGPLLPRKKGLIPGQRIRSSIFEKSGHKAATPRDTLILIQSHWARMEATRKNSLMGLRNCSKVKQRSKGVESFEVGMCAVEDTFCKCPATRDDDKDPNKTRGTPTDATAGGGSGVGGPMQSALTCGMPERESQAAPAVCDQPTLTYVCGTTCHLAAMAEVPTEVEIDDSDDVSFLGPPLKRPRHNPALPTDDLYADYQYPA